MSSAGQQLVAGRIPGERIATETETSDSADIAAVDGETEIMSIDFAAVAGRVYGIRAAGAVEGTGDERVQLRIEEDLVGGNTLQLRNVHVADSSGFGSPYDEYAEYTADATETKTIIVSLVINSGTGPVNLAASTTRIAFLFVNYIRG